MSEQQNKSSVLFKEFTPTSTEEWEKILTRDLEGADYQEKLKWETIEGIEALPFYRREDLQDLPHVVEDQDIHVPCRWEICEPIDNANIKKANEQALEAVKGGANSLLFTIRISPDVGMLGGDITGTQVQNLESLELLLDGIDISKTGLVFDSAVGSVAMLGMLKAYLDKSGTSPGPPIAFTFDPFTYIARHGRLPAPESEIDQMITQMASETNFKTLVADGTFYHNSGATIIQELGIALSIGSEFLARIPEKERNQAAKQFWMRLSAGSLFFPEIAKFRAARLLWNRVLDGYQISDRQPLMIHVETSKWNKSIADPHNNMLRATTEATSAVVGGANQITIHPYNSTFEESNSFSRRIARNIHHILEEEAHLSAVGNTADGSYYIEVLTAEIARKAWEYFQMIEKQGGFLKAVEGKTIQGEVGRSRKTKEDALQTRQLILTGVNHYPDSKQELPDNLYQSKPVDSFHKTGAEPEIAPDNLVPTIMEAFKDGVAVGDVVSSFLKPQKQLYPALKPHRAAEPFEQIRLRTQHYTSNGKKVNVQLIPIGDKKMRKARSTFAKNFLACAGFYVDNPIGFDSLDEAENELGGSPADIVVLCGADEEYPDLVRSFCDRFKNKDTIVVLAGNPGEKEEEYKNAGIDFFIYSGSNMVETLSKIQEKVGMSKDRVQ